MLYKDLSEDGVEPSGGEAQKIAIARALYKDAPFIILDEPTAALDPVAEAEIYARFELDRMLQAIRHPFLFLTGYPPVNFATRSSCSMRGRLSSREPTPN